MRISKNSDQQYQLSNQTHKETLIKFIGLLIILFSYFAYVSWEYDVSTGLGLVLLTWSFFVLCTPIGDGGFLIAFPVRLLFGIKMVMTQIVLWLLAVAINIYFLFFSVNTYQLTFLTRLLHHIFIQPFPYWGILIVSALGTFLSVYFGDELIDVTTHKDREKYHKHGFKYHIISLIALGIITVTAYYHLLSSLGIHLPK